VQRGRYVCESAMSLCVSGRYFVVRIFCGFLLPLSFVSFGICCVEQHQAHYDEHAQRHQSHEQDWHIPPLSPSLRRLVTAIGDGGHAPP
jgi:hypothetical protein